MRIFRRFRILLLPATIASVGLAGAAGAQPGPQEAAPGGWELTAQAGPGMSFYFGDQAADAVFGLAAGRFLSESLQVETELLAVPGATHARTREESNADGALYLDEFRVRRQMYVAMTRLNLYLGEGATRPYLSFGTGLGWGSEEFNHRSICVAGVCDPDAPTRSHDQSGLALATLLGTGVDIRLADGWRLRPEVVMPYLWGAPQPGFVTVTMGITFNTEPRPAVQRHLPPPPPRATDPDEAWRTVQQLPLGDVIRVELRRSTVGVRDGRMARPQQRVIVGHFVAADDELVVLRVERGADAGTWRFMRARVDRIERGHLDRNGPWEGVLGGFVTGALVGAAGYLGSGGGDDHQIWMALGPIMFGGPAALIGGLSDHFHRSFEATGVAYDARRSSSAGGEAGDCC